MNYSYFDEAYFENGEERGTAYSNYIKSSRSSPTYREIAEACRALQPERVLEIGCATGIIVNRLNQMGVEAHGIDVSSWAIEHREHPNVILAGAEKLPYPDGYFDLIYSVHALEHIPDHLAPEAFSELRRVSRPSAVHLHTLPIVGEGPYAGEPQAVIAALKKDPTHNLLFDRAWWLHEFGKIGLSDVGAHMLFRNEDVPDLSISQLLLVSSGSQTTALLARIRDWNAAVLSALSDDIRKLSVIHTPTMTKYSQMLDLSGRWADVEAKASFELDDDLLLTATVILKSAQPITLRFCFLSGQGDELDLIRTYRPGTTTFQFRKDDLWERMGVAGNVTRVLFGGEGAAEISVALTAERNGEVVFSMQD